MADNTQHARRTLLSLLGIGAFAAGVTTASTSAFAQTAASRPWQPARHAQDDWLDQIPGVHRFVMDTTAPAGFGTAMLFVGNFFTANGSGYGLKDADLAVVLVARHDSTPFTFNDSMWAKYGPSLTRRSRFVDPATNAPPVVNVHRRALEGLLARGVHLAVCQMSMRNLSTTIAAAGGPTADSAYAELSANLMNHAHIVPAGIVAVNRAQERGYTFAHAV